MEFRIAASAEDIAAAYPVMLELRPHFAQDGFAAQVRKQQESHGYRLVLGEDEGVLVALAGFRIAESLSWGRYLYVDDLVVAPRHRSRGYGGRMLSWLHAVAESEGCAQLHLDCGLQREDAHRFYEREGLRRSGYHFVRML